MNKHMTPLQMYNYYTYQHERCLDIAEALKASYAAREHIEQACWSADANKGLMELWGDIVRRNNYYDNCDKA